MWIGIVRGARVVPLDPAVHTGAMSLAFLSRRKCVALFLALLVAPLAPSKAAPAPPQEASDPQAQEVTSDGRSSTADYVIRARIDDAPSSDLDDGPQKSLAGELELSWTNGSGEDVSDFGSTFTSTLTPTTAVCT